MDDIAREPYQRAQKTVSARLAPALGTTLFTLDVRDNLTSIQYDCLHCR